MTKFILIIFFGISNIALFGQTKYASNGIRFKLPKGFKATRSRGSDFATFTRGETLQIGFANGCDSYIERSDAKLSKDMTADLCFSILFVKMKAGEKTTWVSNPKDTVIHKFPCKWAEFHTTVGKQDYYMVYFLVKGKRHKYEIAFSGHLANKEDDLKILRKIMSSYKGKSRGGILTGVSSGLDGWSAAKCGKKKRPCIKAFNSSRILTDLLFQIVYLTLQSLVLSFHQIHFLPELDHV